MDNNEKLVKLVEEAAIRGAEKGAKSGSRKSSFLVIVLVLCFGILGFLYVRNYIDSGWDKLTENLKQLVEVESPAESHDMVLDNDGFLGYTAADFASAILSDTKQLKKIEVYETKISDAVTITDTGLANIKAFSKSQVITFNGTAIYTIDLTNLNENCITVDEENKTIVLTIPHAEQGTINIPSDEMKFSDVNKGWLAFGDIKITMEQSAEVQTEARNEMDKKLLELDELSKADKFAKMIVWEMYQPLITSVSPEYKLKIDF